MASLTAYLRRFEWNAAYCVGMHAAGEGLVPRPRDLGDTLRQGILLLFAEGMRFDGVEVREHHIDGIEKVTMIDDPGNSLALVDVMQGGPPLRARIEEFIGWADYHASMNN